MKDFFFKYYNRFIALIWMVLMFALWMQFVNRSPLLESFLFVLCSLILAFPVITFVSRYLLPRALKAKTIKVFAAGLIVSIFLLALLLALNAEMFGWLEKQGVFGSSTMVSATLIPLHLRFFSLISASIFVILGFCGIEFFREHHKISQENYRILQEHARLQQIHLEDQLQLLKDQINPHSMFNVLNHIHVLMQNDVDLASELLVKFSEILRYQLYDCNKQYVKLKDEIQYLKDVIEVEKMR
jgi:sensor histidine kinase YesM